MVIQLRNLLAVAALSCGALTAVAQAANDAPSALTALFERSWERDLRENPLLATHLGDRRYDREWPDLSLAALAASHAADIATLKELAGIDRGALSAADQLNYDLFEREYRNRLRTHEFKPYLYLINHQGGIQTLSETAELLPFGTVADYEAWIARLRRVGTYVDQHIDLLKIAARERRTQPRVIMERIVPQLAQQVVTDPAQSPFYAPFTRIPDTIAAVERERLAAAGRAAVAEVVLPAYARLQRHFSAKYLPACRKSVGIWDTPRGAEYYRERIAYHTTVSDLTAEQIHDIGFAEVARIRAAMDQVIVQIGFTGGFQQFVADLRSNPKFYYESPEALHDAYLVISKRIDPQLVKLFRKLPRTPYGVRPIPATSAPNTTTAYYQPPAADGTRPGYYYVNLYRPEVRPKYEMEVLTVHEAMPGHHLQIALALEQSGLPAFRRNAGYTAYVEGWALYSESLGEELGLYADPYSKFGQLTYDMWRAVRLVVDTGLHAKKWSRQQAIDYFKANAAKTEADIVNEIDRYISWPGQALAYKIGQLRIRDLRATAQSELGPRFDLRDFHDELLSTGAVPLEVMEANLQRWIEAQAAR